MKNKKNEFSPIKGWGVDVDSNNDPTYPFQKRKVRPLRYIRKDQQQQMLEGEVLYSNERPFVSAVFGLGPKPSGISGKLRHFAFDHGENEYSHWLPLLLADRLGTIEGIIYDIKHGSLPSIIAEKGWPAQLKFDKKGLIKKLAFFTALTTGAYLMLTKPNKF